MLEVCFMTLRLPTDPWFLFLLLKKGFDSSWSGSLTLVTEAAFLSTLSRAFSILSLICSIFCYSASFLAWSLLYSKSFFSFCFWRKFSLLVYSFSTLYVDIFLALFCTLVGGFRPLGGLAAGAFFSSSFCFYIESLSCFCSSRSVLTIDDSSAIWSFWTTLWWATAFIAFLSFSLGASFEMRLRILSPGGSMGSAITC